MLFEGLHSGCLSCRVQGGSVDLRAGEVFAWRGGARPPRYEFEL